MAVVVIKYTLNFIDPLSFLFFRFLISSAILFPFFLIFIKKHPISKKDFLKLFLLGTLSTTVTLYLLFEGMKYTTAIDVSLISLLGPIMIVFAGSHFLKEKVARREKIGLSIAVFGALIAIMEPLLKRNNGNSQALFGNFLVFLSYVAWTIYIILYKKDSLKYHPITVTFFSFFSGLLTLTPFFLISKFPITHYSLLITPPLAALPGILYMSIFSSCIAFFTYNLGVSLIEASEATLFDYLKPIFTAPLAFFWLGEKVSLPFLIGAVIITIGVGISESRPVKRKRNDKLLAH
ncbi:EamA family transporter [Candidatus Microgenomates bacterium]|nr:EamA family transporter [Candidatus Microgenomates bacterium]